ncbi:MAG: phosphoenolpyruvate--protein phosphotransferase [Candidatus Promineifilaceae bacterium]|nr:phosphoenolpyruvate--protein phosphotransferase [Candidatus Promineifilaceae bacterium]
MKQLDIIIHNPTGLHARPAKVFVNTAKQFESDIRVEHGEKKANAKSLISMLTLGVERGSQIRILVDGVDEDVAIQELEKAVANGLGEGDEHEKAPTAQGPKPTNGQQPIPEVTETASNMLRGIPAAPGIAIGPIYRLQHEEIEIDETFQSVSAEQDRLQKAIEKARGQLIVLHKQMMKSAAASEAAIFEVHQEILEDPDLLDAVLAKIEKQQSAAHAWQSTIDARAQAMAKLNDPLLAGRAADIQDVGYRVLRLLMGSDDQRVSLPDHPVILVAEDLSPSDTASLDRDRVLGFCTSAGGPTAHSAIIARALSLPAVVSIGERVLELDNLTTVILNGSNGTLIIEPDAAALGTAQAQQQQLQTAMSDAQKSAGQPAITQDGHRVEVVANIGGVADAEKAAASGAEGVGLLRTEFLFLERTTAPTEQEQFEVYRDIVQAMNGQPVIVRTLDIGGDKPLPYIDVAPEANPFLGERGIRLCLNRPELLRQQLRAILRAAEFGPLRIMFPMVADLSEWRAARAMVAEVQAELNAPTVELGIMIEVPSAALMADAFAHEVDFFSVGTNDLTQYTLAMDRMHPSLAGKSDGLHPAVLRLISRAVEAAHAAGKWTGVCGELGADPQAVPILLGMGVDELSVSVPAIATVKAQIRSLTQADAKQKAQRALACGTAAEVRNSGS